MIKKGVLKRLVGNRPSAVFEKELGSFIKQNSTNCLEEKEIKHLNDQLDQALKDYEELQKKIDEAIEWVQWFRKDNKDFFKEEKLTASELDGLLKILKGE